MRVVVVGVGAAGARAARQLTFLGPLDDLVVVDADTARAAQVAESLGDLARSGDPSAPLATLEAGDIALLATPDGHAALAGEALARGAHVVSMGDGIDDVRDLLALDETAKARDLNVAVGAAFSPGLSCVLAALGARAFERVDEIHVAKVGAGGPACARRQHDARAGEGWEWRDGTWQQYRGGSGRELCWFPDPVRGVDCYRAELPEPLLLHAAFPGANRLTARIGANRRERLTARLPAIRRASGESQLGAIRVEIRGAQGVALDDRVLGAVDWPAVAAGAVAAMAARFLIDGRVAHRGACGLADLVEPGPFLATLADRGVKVAAFEGAQHGDADPTAAAS